VARIRWTPRSAAEDCSLAYQRPVRELLEAQRRKIVLSSSIMA
jgi:hypothetical protein